MRKCLFEDQIDDYLLNRLEGEQKDRFEEHYFNCSHCFAKIEERQALVSTIKAKGAWLFAQDREPERKAWVPSFQDIVSFFTAQPLATVAVTSALILVVVFGVLPQLRHSTPQFVLSDTEVVRGQSLSLISPVIDVNSVPAVFEWAKLGQAAEYKIYVYNSQLLWSTKTVENRIAVPENIKQEMVAGQKYSWQVKAFSAKGTLIAVSSRVQFQINRGN
jgi:hypothetical protein